MALNAYTVFSDSGSTKVEPHVVGKPSQFVLEAIATKTGVSKDRICMVGDRLDTDVLFGQQGGLATMLVLSGGGSGLWEWGHKGAMDGRVCVSSSQGLVIKDSKGESQDPCELSGM